MKREFVTAAFGLIISLTARAASATCSPETFNRPVCPSAAVDAEASFVDPTAKISRPDHMFMKPRSYIAPFAQIDAEQGVLVGEEANIQDSAVLQTERGPIVIGDHTILAHGARVFGPSVVGTPPGSDEVAPSFVGFNSVVDGAVLAPGSMVLHLARVGRGVTVPTGRVVLSGKSIDAQCEAEDYDLGKVVPLTVALRVFMDEVIHVNTAFASGYTRLYREDPTNVYGINYDPANSDFDPSRSLPTLDGVTVRAPKYRGRIIGDARLEDSFGTLADRRRVGRGLSIRADEGQPFWIGSLGRVSDHVTIHALEHTTVATGNRVRLGRHAIVHGGDSAATEGGSTTIGAHSRIGDHAVVFRSVLGWRVEVGCGSVVDGATLPPGTHVPALTVVTNEGHDDATTYPVEWNPGCDAAD